MSQRKYLRAVETTLSITEENCVAVHTYHEEMPSQYSWTNQRHTSSSEKSCVSNDGDIDERIFHAFLADDAGNAINITDKSDVSDGDANSNWMFFLIFNLPQRAMTHLLQLFRRLGHDVPSSFAQLKRRHTSTISSFLRQTSIPKNWLRIFDTSL